MDVTATERIMDEGQVFAEVGAIGEVLGLERQPDGVVAATVLFPGAPRATTTYVGEDCELAARWTLVG